MTDDKFRYRAIGRGPICHLSFVICDALRLAIGYWLLLFANELQTSSHAYEFRCARVCDLGGYGFYFLR